MFENLKSKTGMGGAEQSGSINIIGQGTTIEGQINANGDLRIDGIILGSVTSKAKVVIGSTGQVQGDVICQNADISGSVKGKTTVNELLFLKSTARINGDIITGKLVVEVGASFSGNCHMGPLIKDIKNVDKQPESQQKEKTA
jgi:cytoskeletal protein CcmA (bactofilin family)